MILLIVQPKHFNPTETQPFFRYWLLAIDAKLGEEIPVYKYLIWNSQQVCKFKELIGEPVSKPLCLIKDGVNRYGEFLRQMTEQESKKLSLFQ